MDSVKFNPIGRFRCAQEFKYDQPRQAGIIANTGTIELLPGNSFEQALIGLQAGDLVWILFQFHHNPKWKPMVRPPRGQGKVGVFATRAPYRPNGLGISVVKIAHIEGLKIQVTDHDLLDGTPIFDIKPYLSYSDSFEGAEPSWLNEHQLYRLEWQANALEKADFLEQQNVQLRSFAEHQLQLNPTDSSRKRVKLVSDNLYQLAYRTWRIEFELADENSIRILDIGTGYDSSDLEPETPDKWNDKSLHRKFIETF